MNEKYICEKCCILLPEMLIPPGIATYAAAFPVPVEIKQSIHRHLQNQLQWKFVNVVLMLKANNAIACIYGKKFDLQKKKKNFHQHFNGDECGIKKKLKCSM